jgi:DUF4097 and DUF4098 domain-containing protein YvlB
MSGPPTTRSGCALALGLLLIVTGALLLASNLFGFSLAGFWTRGLIMFSLYWPVLLILWGAIKIYQRFYNPAAARVSAGEVVLLILIICAGVTLAAARYVAGTASIDLSMDDLLEMIEPDISLGPAHRFSEEHTFELAEGGSLLVENDRGAITARGWDEPDLKVVVTKRIYRHSQDEANRLAEDARVRFELSDEGAARLEIERDRDRGARGALETDLELWIPRNTPLTLTNGRGAIQVSDLRAPLGLATAYDSIEVNDVEGRVTVDGRHGPIRLEGVVGDVEARNRFGDLTVKDLAGSLLAETASGSISVERITGTVRLTNRSSRIRAIEIGEDLTIEAAHTEVSVERAGSDVAIQTSYRPVFVNQVEGRVAVEAHNSEVEIRQVRGDVGVESIHRLVTVVGVEGGVLVDAQHGAVRVEEILGPIQVENSDHPVEIDSFASSLRVESSHAPLRIATDSLRGELTLTTSYGDVDLTLPADSSFRLEAKTRSGNISSEFFDSTWTRREEGRRVRRQRGVAGLYPDQLRKHRRA